MKGVGCRYFLLPADVAICYRTRLRRPIAYRLIELFLLSLQKLERELAEEYDAYVTRHRNLAYLQHELDLHNKVGLH